MICKVDDCNKLTTSKLGYCNKHLKKRKVMIYLLKKNFLARVDKFEEYSYKGLEGK